MAALIAASPSQPLAQSSREAHQPPRVEVWVGGSAGRDSWSLYTGGTSAPFGDLLAPGLRFRATAGGGASRYSSARFNATTNSSETVPFRDVSAFADALVGLQLQFGTLTLKAFAGAAMVQKTVSPFDDEAILLGQHVGGKVAVDVWWNATPWLWASLDLNATTLGDATSARAAIAYRLNPSWSIGAEASFYRDLRGHNERAGILVRYNIPRVELSVSGGVDFKAGASPVPYATAKAAVRF